MAYPSNSKPKLSKYSLMFNSCPSYSLTSSRARRGIPKHHYLSFCFFPFRVFCNCPPGSPELNSGACLAAHSAPLTLWLSGLMSAPQTVTASPAAKIFFPALMSLSMLSVPQLGQSQLRTSRGSFSTTKPIVYC